MSDDPCDALSDGLTNILWDELRLERMPKNIRRVVANASYGKFSQGRGLSAHDQYMRLRAPAISRFLSGKLREMTDNRIFGTLVQSRPRAMRELYDNPISPRTWTLDDQ